jgi:Transposase IS66 family
VTALHWTASSWRVKWGNYVEGDSLSIATRNGHDKQSEHEHGGLTIPHDFLNPLRLTFQEKCPPHTCTRTVDSNVISNAPFRHWAHYRDGTISRAALQRRMAPVRRAVERLLLRGIQSGNRLLVGMCRELYEHRDWLWAFVREAGVEPTNNASERALRHAVIWRKLSFGTQSAAGSRFVETMLTAIETCRQQQRLIFDYLVEALQAYYAGRKAPSLLPRA